MIRSKHAHLKVYADSHPGMTGKNNEDRFAVSAFRLENHTQTPVLLAVLSDGIGGHRAGEVAAEMAVNIISQHVAASDGNNPLQILQEAVQVASARIYESSLSEEGRRGMGATCACVLIVGDQMFMGNVGDTRVYLMRGSQIYQTSTDHTWLQEALDAGILKADQLEGHPNAHVIRRYLGSAKPVQVDIRLRLGPKETQAEAEANQGLPLRKGDTLLLCSDGLTDLVKNEEILQAFKKYPLREACKRLIDLANQRGGHDNITLIAIQVPSQGISRSPLLRFLMWLVIAGLLLFLLATGLVYGWLWYSGTMQPTSTNVPATMPPPTFVVPSLTSTSPTVEKQQMPVAVTDTPALPQEWVFPSPTDTLSVFHWDEKFATLTPWPTNTPLPPTETPTPTVLFKPTQTQSLTSQP
ncbi:MAG: serine/threonine-protein phosphatase [Anaerolineae bacterium]|nr:serine/threonine-protein phosphatase [Anaerolineae bacterium]